MARLRLSYETHAALNPLIQADMERRYPFSVDGPTFTGVTRTSDISEAMFEFFQRDCPFTSRAAEMVDPVFAQALERYEAWSGSCAYSDPDTRLGIEAGVRLIRVDALECAFRSRLAGRSWTAVPDEERARLAPLLVRLYIQTRDPAWRTYNVCTIDRLTRMHLDFQTYNDFEWVGYQPRHVRTAIPEDFARVSEAFFDCG